MCGIIAVARRPSDRTPPRTADVLGLVDGTAELITSARTAHDLLGRLAQVDASASAPPTPSCGAPPGVRALLADPRLVERARARPGRRGRRHRRPRRPPGGRAGRASPPSSQEAVNAALVAVRDEAWALGRDRLRTARAGRRARRAVGAAGPPIEAMTSVQPALSALDRLEVRGRDSAGLTVLVRGHGLDLDRRRLVAGLIADRLRPALRLGLGPGRRRLPVVRLQGGGRDRRAGRQLRRPPRRHRRRRPPAPGPRADGAEAVVLGHTRWASVGIISQANAHPVNSEEDCEPSDGPFVTAALNGDIDNFADLKAAAGLLLRPRDHHRRQGDPHPREPGPRRGATTTRPRRSGARSPRFDGSVAIGASVAADPSHPAARPARQRPGPLRRPRRRPLPRGLRALRRGRGVRPPTCASTARRRPTRPTPPAAGARSWCSTPAAPASLDGHPPAVLRRRRPPRRPRPSCAGPRSPPATSTGATTRTSCSRRSRESPYVVPQDPAGQDRLADGDLLEARLGRRDPARTSPARPSATASSPGCSPSARAPPRSRARPSPPPSTALTAGTDLRVEARLATELSGFALRPDMTDTLVVAVSQSGTTTDTNRTVDLARARGAVGHQHRQPAGQRPHRPLRRRALHLRRARRGDERGVDQGVLRPGRGGHPARRRHRRRGGPHRRRARRSAPASWPGCGPCPTPWSEVLETRPAIAAAAQLAGPDQALLGHRRLRAPTGSRPRRSGSSCRSSATRPSPATPPRTRSTSTCRRSR